MRRGTTVHPSGAITVSEFQEERNKFLEEGQRLAQFQHPSIVKVFSLFEENNTAYMVMEFLNGKTLLKMVEESGHLDEGLLVLYIDQVAEALAVVHQANMIHRDIKPENILVTPESRAVLVDFGTAREFASGKTRKMTTMLTPGYAPLEQYGQHARFGVFTDIYSLGATAYHLLTGQVPIQATDRAAGVELAVPKRLNASISRQVNDAVMWAMEMRVDQRPQTASDFIQAFRGARSASTNGSAGGTATSPQGTPNPYEAKILQLISELEPRQTPSQTAYDKRLNEVSSMLLAISSAPHVHMNDCPVCYNSTLQYFEGQRSPLCPVCSGTRLRSRKLDPTLCPVCREGHLSRTKLQSQLVFCPICRSRSLREEKRKRFGLSIDLWWVCPGCSAEFDVLIGGRAKLVSAKNDPFGLGKTYEGQTLPIGAWQQLAPLSESFWGCDRCNAKLYELEDSRLCLDSIGHDPHGVSDKLLGKSYYRTFWVKLANGLPAKVGTTHCPGCYADFDYDSVDKKLKLLHCDHTQFPAAVAQCGQFHSLEHWSLFAAGKKSLRPGWLCSSCRAEYDKDESGMKLIAGSSKLSLCLGETRTFEDWHRWSRELPTQNEEEQLKKELSRLETQKQQELLRLSKVEQDRRCALEKKVQDLVKQSFIGGFINLGLTTHSVSLKRDERVVWESGTVKLKQRTSNGIPYWETDASGTLVVTEQRIIFRSDIGTMWSKPLTKLLGANHEYLGNHGITVIWIEGNQKPVAFGAPPTSATATIQGHSVPIELTSHDLREVLHSRCGG
jgi:serine/threonine protein kinase